MRSVLARLITILNILLLYKQSFSILIYDSFSLPTR
jgi:hypothetical protein